MQTSAGWRGLARIGAVAGLAAAGILAAWIGVHRHRDAQRQRHAAQWLAHQQELRAREQRLTVEDCAIFRDLIDQVADADQRTCIIADQTTGGGLKEYMDISGEFDVRTLPQEAVTEFERRGKRSLPIPRFEANRTLQFVPPPQIDALFAHGVGGWKDFHRAFPNANGSWRFSAPGYSSNGRGALADYGYGCGPLCAQFGLCWVEKVEGHWKIVRVLSGGVA